MVGHSQFLAEIQALSGYTSIYTKSNFLSLSLSGSVILTCCQYWESVVMDLGTASCIPTSREGLSCATSHTHSLSPPPGPSLSLSLSLVSQRLTDRRLTVACQVASALHYLHTHSDKVFIHRDVKRCALSLSLSLTQRVILSVPTYCWLTTGRLPSEIMGS